MNFHRNPYDKFLKPEQVETKRIVEFLLFNEPYKSSIWFHPLNEGKRSNFEKYLFKIMGGLKFVPDFIFLEARKGYHGLLLEHKKEGTILFNKDGTPRAAVADQHAFLLRAEAKGYLADFTVGYDDAIYQIKNYFE